MLEGELSKLIVMSDIEEFYLNIFENSFLIGLLYEGVGQDEVTVYINDKPIYIVTYRSPMDDMLDPVKLSVGDVLKFKVQSDSLDIQQLVPRFTKKSNEHLKFINYSIDLLGKK